MAEKLQERGKMDKRYFWNLRTVYPTDAAWEKAFQELDKEIKRIAKFQGKLKDASSILKFFQAEVAAERKIAKVYTYAHLRKDEDTRAEKAQAMYARSMTKYVEYSTATAFAEPEILSIPQAKLEKIAADKKLAPFRYQMEVLLRRKAHTLPGDVENVMARFGELYGAPREIANALLDADLVFDPVTDGKGRKQELTNSNYILTQYSNDRVLRKNAFHSYYKTYAEHNNTFAAAYASNVKQMITRAKIRHYDSSRAMAMFHENIPASVYDGLIATVHKHLPTMYRYLKLRKKMLHVRDLHYYDIYTPLLSADQKKYTYEQAQKLVLDTVSIFGDDYTKTVQNAFKDGWIDVYPNKGKRGGAYSSGCYDTNPYILLNYTGTLDAVSTIIHEMGHSMHSYYSRKYQSPQNADYTIFVAEVASTVNENLLVELLLKKTRAPKARLALLNQYLENFRGTVFRQTMFAEFEMKAHAAAERGEALNGAALNKIYRALIDRYFGNMLVIDDEVQYEWSRIPHFYNSFYVYKYATGYSAATALSEAIRKEGKPAVKRYLEFLQLGGSVDPIDALKHAGVDLTKRAPIESAMRKFAAVLDEAEQTASQLGF